MLRTRLLLAAPIATGLAVDADLSEASLEDLAIQIAQATDARGLKIALRPDKLIIGVGEMFNATRILKNNNQPYSSTNDINALKSMNVFPGGVVVNHYLANPHAFFIRTMGVQDGMIYQKRVGIEFTQDNDFDTENHKYKGYERYGFGFGDPLALFASNGP